MKRETLSHSDIGILDPSLHTILYEKLLREHLDLQ